VGFPRLISVQNANEKQKKLGMTRLQMQQGKCQTDEGSPGKIWGGGSKGT